MVMVDRSQFFIKLCFRGNFLDSHRINDGQVIAFSVAVDTPAREFKQELFSQLELTELAAVPDVVFKLRSNDGALLPISSNLSVNEAESPYVMEVVRVQQQEGNPDKEHVPLFVHDAIAVVQTKISNLNHRIDAVEKLIPGLAERQRDRTNDELERLSQQLVYMERHVAELEKDASCQ